MSVRWNQDPSWSRTPSGMPPGKRPKPFLMPAVLEALHDTPCPAPWWWPFSARLLRWFRHPAGRSVEQGTVLDRTSERGEWWVIPLPYGGSGAIALKSTSLFGTRRGAETGSTA